MKNKRREVFTEAEQKLNASLGVMSGIMLCKIAVS